MLVDGIFWWLYWRAQEAGYLNLHGQTTYEVVKHYADHLNGQIKKLHGSKLLPLARLPDA